MRRSSPLRFPRAHSRCVPSYYTALAAAVIVLVSVRIPSVHAQLNRLNITGAFNGSFIGGSEFHLTQDGDRVVGKFTSGNGDGFARGTWQDGRLILILTPTTDQVGGSCDPARWS